MTTNPDISLDPIVMDVVHSSYDRCMQNSDFLLRFYKIFMERHKIIPTLFAKTHMARQAQALAHGLNMMIHWLRDPEDEMAKSVIEDIRISHGQHHLNIQPQLYDFWIDSLIQAVSECDPEYSQKIEAAWHLAMRPGIEYIKSGYSEN